MPRTSPLEEARRNFIPQLPEAFSRLAQSETPLKVGVVLSGGQAPGGHNVISGLFDALRSIHPQSELIGFVNGPKGILSNDFISLNEEAIAPYRNQGGFHIIGSGRDKIESEDHFSTALRVCSELDLDGLVIIGGDDSNTNAYFLSDYFAKHQAKTVVVGVPKTIDGDLQNKDIAISFGFDTATKIYSETIGNIAKDALSARKYYFFIKLMGRSASHVALECALQTQPNHTLIGEEIAEKEMHLEEVVNQLANLIEERAQHDKHYGLILIPEGIIEFIPDMKVLVSELNQLISEGKDLSHLSGEAQKTFSLLPKTIQEQLLLDRDPHGNVQVSKIETEKLFIEMVSKKLDPSIPFKAQGIFCGYEGRSAMPSFFDTHYCYALGHTAASLIAAKKNGYMATVQNLSKPIQEWTPHFSLIEAMLHTEIRKGKEKRVIKKALVECSREPFLNFAKKRKTWKLEDSYVQIGPMQFFGPEEIQETRPLSLR